ncbi:MAG: hypothetical protein UU47_C0019G0013 [candidate division TM6 bacterium GW2011_GWE2_41_16]|nr:MAG: hypothetical protein UU47_C0019G0013 [candidate division TM6 bacterium GW2011_GWE2_41_16]
MNIFFCALSLSVCMVPVYFYAMERDEHKVIEFHFPSLGQAQRNMQVPFHVQHLKEKIETLLLGFPEGVLHRDEHENTLLHTLMQSKSIALNVLYVCVFEFKVGLNAVNRDGFTPLMLLADREELPNRYEMLVLLLSAGANPLIERRFDREIMTARGRFELFLGNRWRECELLLQQAERVWRQHQHNPAEIEHFKDDLKQLIHRSDFWPDASI